MWYGIKPPRKKGYQEVSNIFLSFRWNFKSDRSADILQMGLAIGARVGKKTRFDGEESGKRGNQIDPLILQPMAMMPIALGTSKQFPLLFLHFLLRMDYIYKISIVDKKYISNQ